MIPPSRDLRERSIRRWMRDQQPQNFHRWNQSGELESRVADLDQMMLDAFEGQDDAIMSQLDREKTWGTQAGMQEYHTQRLQAWSEIAAQYLPTSSSA